MNQGRVVAVEPYSGLYIPLGTRTAFTKPRGCPEPSQWAWREGEDARDAEVAAKLAAIRREARRNFHREVDAGRSEARTARP